MYIFRWAVIAVVYTTLSVSGCGYFPSEMSIPGKVPAKRPPPHARITGKPHVVSCATPARGFPSISFDDVFTFTENPRQPFRESSSLPPHFDVVGYVWGAERCTPAAFCSSGDYYQLLGRGPSGDFQTWISTPQYPRITIQSPCAKRLQVGQGYRFSFSDGQLVGFSPD
ncbi:hypothetical protein MO867_10260 [Microbulbifer sp. OS29]|uniref:Lipoprotein n=1 Tax=Microbulbifer okhotskensis TaxID=2926617 RepID=A0A9X2J513_9GAMM|nr:hypothetical protein [Microbulbifer okhotskensis]MCO1334723.1 hypothetical protein [Microbulbifer okhotskensis]